MTFEKFDEYCEQVFEKLRTLRKTKGKEYANNDADRLANFKEIGTEMEISALKVLNVYMKKHSRAIDSYIKRGQIFSDESIESRFEDQIMYSLLAMGLIKDEKDKENARRDSSKNRKRINSLFTETKRKRVHQKSKK